MVITSKDAPPPSYDSLNPPPSSHPNDQKRPIPPWPPTSSGAGPSRPPLPVQSPSQAAQWPVWSPGYWKRRGEEQEISRTVRALLHDVIHNLSDPSSLDVLYSSHHACASHGISFPALSQEDIEQHPALYWAILTLSPYAKSLPGGSLASAPPEGGWPALDLLAAFPLTDSTRREATTACVLGDDNALYQYLLQTEGFAPVGLAESITSRPSAGAAGPRAVDVVQVQHVADGRAGHFRLRVRLRDWLRRMRMHKKVAVRWIARGRAWQLIFGIADGNHFSTGTWYCGVALIRDTGSNKAELHATLSIGSATPAAASSSTATSEDLLTPDPAPSVEEGTGPPEPRPLVSITLKKSTLDPYSDGCYVKLSDFPGAASLEYEDSPYIEGDGSVWVEGDFVLEKS